ncbi:siderophore ABC transporter substrate-binding protein [Evansella sp. AB-rgal1]|uniref:siderophore ABC transporter substrate-binding protein n=1 Tax=Evansella sp. AB-rgal1 TaxID=3242696 RepID=UPI00359D1314
MKKIFSLLVVLLLAIMFIVACAESDASEPSGSAESDQEESHNNEDNNDADAANNNGNNDVPTEMVVTHDLGETTVPVNPEKVVVFDNGSLDTLDKLGANVIAVPQASIPPYLSKYEDSSYTNAGTLFEPDFETIFGLQPDLIIISGRTAEAYDELADIAPTIFLGVDTTNYMESFKHNTTILGQIFNQEEFIAAELAKLDEAVAQLAADAATTEETALVVLANDGSVSAYGPGSRFGIIHNEFGLTPADQNIEVSNHGQNVSFEYILEVNPDYLFVVDRGAIVGGENPAEAMFDNDIMKNTKVYENGTIFYLDPYAWYTAGGGLESVELMITQIQEALK